MEKQNKNKCYISKLFQNAYYFLLSGQLCSYCPEVSYNTHYKWNSMALIYQQTLKTSLSLGSVSRRLLGKKKKKSKQLHTHGCILKGDWQVPQWQYLDFCRPKFHEQKCLQWQKNFKKLVNRCGIETWLKKHQWHLSFNHMTSSTLRFKCNFSKGSNASRGPVFSSQSEARWRVQGSQSACSRGCWKYSSFSSLICQQQLSNQKWPFQFFHSFSKYLLRAKFWYVEFIFILFFRGFFFLNQITKIMGLHIEKVCGLNTFLKESYIYNRTTCTVMAPVLQE